jgi:hypothetical protein
VRHYEVASTVSRIAPTAVTHIQQVETSHRELEQPALIAPNAAVTLPAAVTPAELRALTQEAKRSVEELGAAEEALTRARYADTPAAPEKLEALVKERGAAKGRIAGVKAKLGRVAAQLAGHMPRDLSVLVGTGLNAGIPWVVGGGPNVFARLNGSNTGRDPAEVGVGFGIAIPIASTGYTLGMPLGENPGPVKSGWAGGLTVGPFSVTAKNPVLGMRTMAFAIPNLFGVSTTDTGGVGAFITIPIPFLPVVRYGVGFFIEHPFFAPVTRPIFSFYDRAVALAKNVATWFRPAPATAKAAT